VAQIQHTTWFYNDAYTEDEKRAAAIAALSSWGLSAPLEEALASARVRRRERPEDAAARALSMWRDGHGLRGYDGREAGGAA
jgi:hypothetical protein